jgi:hypothetical protein
MLPVEPVIKSTAQKFDCDIESVDLSVDRVNEHLNGLPEISEVDDPVTGPSNLKSTMERVDKLALEKGKGPSLLEPAIGPGSVADHDPTERKRPTRQSHFQIGELLNFSSPPPEDPWVLGSLILDPSHPMVDRWADRRGGRLDRDDSADIIVSQEDDIGLQVAGSTGTRGFLFFQSKRHEESRLAGHRRVRYELANPRIMFRNVCQNEEALSWVSSFTNHGENIFLIVGYLVFADAEWNYANRNAREVQASIQSIGLSSDPVGVLAGVPPDVQVGGQSIAGESKLFYKAPGNRIWAIGHRQIKFPLFGRRELSRAKLQPKTTWTVIAGE